MTETLAPIDYGSSGMSIQRAMLDHVRRFPRKSNRPPYILWGGKKVLTADELLVPQQGYLIGEFLSLKGDPDQGFDISIRGYIQLEDGERVQRLRTWNDPQYEPRVRYPFRSEDGTLRVWNVYRVARGKGKPVDERWTGNAGFWVEPISDLDKIYHCSPGTANKPDFESLVFRITVQIGAEEDEANWRAERTKRIERER
ncbi:MAG: hypothetical protein JW741_24770 [Sedimentisphaerales bacterium]|nr:hypothetical protein [Sedimentisphaerales bacterium]